MLRSSASRIVRALSFVSLLVGIPAAASAQLVVGPGPGGPATLQLIESTGTRTIDAFGGFLGGVSVTLGDVNGDGTVDVIAGAGPGGSPHVRVFSGTDLSELASFFAFDPAFRGGVHVAAGDVNGDGRADIVTGAGSGGGPHVRVFSGQDLSELASFFAFDPAFRGGVTVAAGDVNGDGLSDIVSGAGPGGGPQVRVLSGRDLSELASLWAYDPAFMGGVQVATGDIDGDGRVDLIFGAGPGGAPHVRILDGRDFSELASFFASVAGSGVSIGSVGDAPGVRFTSASSTTFTAGSAGTFTVSTAGSPVPALTSSGALPTGVTFVDNGDGTATLAGTPAAGTGGAYSLTFTATNGIGTPATQTFTLTVNQPPAITSAASINFTLGAPGTFQVTTSGFPRPAITRGGATLPSGITWVDNGNGTGTLSGTAPAGTGGTYALTFTADNGVSPAATQSFTLTISGAPTVTSASSATFSVGSAGTFTVTAAGTPTPALSITGALPSGVTFLDNGNGTGTLSGTPAAGTAGARVITITASNGVLPNGTQTFTLNVNEGPAITSAASTTFFVGAAGSFSVTTSGFPAPSLAHGGSALPSGVTFVDNGNGTGTLSGTPAAGTGGTYALTFTATNSTASAVQNFTLTVVGSPSITSANTTTFTVGSAGTFTITTTGTPTPAITATGGLPGGITLTDNGDGTATLSGTPAAKTGGTYPLTLTAANGIGTNATQSFTLVVNEAPAITSASSTAFTVGAAGAFTITTSGFPAASIARGGATLPSGVTFTDNGNGTATLAGTPAAATGGTYAITFTATNAAGSTAPQAFTLTVNQMPAITSASTVTFVAGTPGTFTVTTTGFPVPSLTRTGVALPSGVTFVDNGDGTGTLSGTAAAGTAGAYAVIFTAANGTSPDATQSFTLNVNEAPGITSAASATFTVGAAESFTVVASGFPTPTVSQAGALPTGVTFTPGPDTLAGTATQTGTFSLIQFTASNGVSPDAVQNFTLNVVCPAITVTPSTLPAGLYQTSYGPVTFLQTGSTGSSLTWSATGLLAGLSIDPASGVVSGSPTTTALSGAVTITVTDNFGCAGSVSTTLTVRPVADNENYTGGVGNTQYVVGATAPLTPAVLVNDNVKTGDLGPGALSVTFPATTANGTIAEGTTDGTFTYTPNVGFGGPSDTFVYTLTDGNGVTNTGTVTINLSSMVWYVNSGAGAGDGRSHTPFNTLSAAAAPSGLNSIIYVHTGTGTTTGNLTMDASQSLFGQGATFTLDGLTIPAGGRPTLSGTVTLANSDTVTAVNFAGAGVALTATGLTQAVTIDQVNVTGGTTALSLSNVSGAVTVTNASFLNTTAAEVLINQGTGGVSIGATISSNAGRSIDIQNRTAGTVAFNGAITDTGQGVFLNANTGSTINFTGGLSLTTTTNPGFTATGGGTVSATQNNTTIVNTITTTTATALNVANTTIGAGGLTFRSISANGAARGIVLTNSGLGPFQVTGVGTADGSGGVIQNSTSRGAELIAANNISLNNMNFTGNGTAQVVPGSDVTCGGDLRTGSNLSCVSNIHLQSVLNVSLTNLNVINGGQMGINGNSVANFSLTDSAVTGNGNESFENGLTFQNLTGTCSITNSMIKDNAAYQIAVANIASDSALTLGITGTRTNAVFPSVDSSTTEIGKTTQTNTNTNQSLLLDTVSTATNVSMTLNLTGVVFKNSLPGNSVLINPIAASGTLGGTTTDSSFDNTAGGVIIQAQNGMSGTYNVTNSEFNKVNLQSILFGGLNPYTGSLQGTISGNRIGQDTTGTSGQACEPAATSNCNGIQVNLIGGSGSISTRIQNNVVEQFGGTGILVTANGNAGPAINANIVNNTVQNPGGLVAHGIQTNIGTTSGANVNACLGITGNTLNGTFEDPGAGVQFGIVTNVRFLATHRLPGFAGTGTSVGGPGNQVTDFIIGNNTTANKVFTQRGATGTYAGGAACITP